MIRIDGGFVGAWLSLVERFVRDEEVAGSNPVAPTISSKVLRCSRDSVRPHYAFCASPNKNAVITIIITSVPST